MSDSATNRLVDDAVPSRRLDLRRGGDPGLAFKTLCFAVMAVILALVLWGVTDFVRGAVVDLHHRDCVAFGGAAGDTCVTADGVSHPWPGRR